MKFRSMPDVIRLTGGASRSKQWLQIFADIFQTPIETPDGTELGALGAAIAGAVATGCYNSYNEAVEAMVHFSSRQEPDPSRKEIYETKYNNYQKVIDTLDPLWKELKS
jgi:L-xylulokinase